MDFIDENANVGLFVLVVVIAVVFLALTVFYQESFNDINERYDIKVKELNKTFVELTTAKSKLFETKESLELKEKREDDLSSVYTKTKSERDILEQDKMSLAQQVDELQMQVSSLNSTVKQLNQVLDTKEEKIDELEATVDSLQDKVDCLKSGNANC